jgi:hypothetical protein
MPDLTLKCVDCQAEFAFVEKDQKFFAEKGYQAPKRCKVCRDKKKAARASGGGDGGGQNRGGDNRDHRDKGSVWSNR